MRNHFSRDRKNKTWKNTEVWERPNKKRKQRKLRFWWKREDRKRVLQKFKKIPFFAQSLTWRITEIIKRPTKWSLKGRERWKKRETRREKRESRWKEDEQKENIKKVKQTFFEGTMLRKKNKQKNDMKNRWKKNWKGKETEKHKT